MKNLSKFTLSVLVAGLISGCNGSGGDTDNTTLDVPVEAIVSTSEVGFVVDNLVGGLEYDLYRAGEVILSSATDDGGSFGYSIGDEIVFKIGGMQLGNKITPQEVVKPTDMLGTAFNSIETINMVRLLTALDADNDLSNGIQISEATKIQAENWTDIDWTSADIAGEMTSSMNEDYIAPGNETDAKDHFLTTQTCLVSGVSYISAGGLGVDSAPTYSLYETDGTFGVYNQSGDAVVIPRFTTLDDYTDQREALNTSFGIPAGYPLTADFFVDTSNDQFEWEFLVRDMGGTIVMQTPPTVFDKLVPQTPTFDVKTVANMTDSITGYGVGGLHLSLKGDILDIEGYDAITDKVFHATTIINLDTRTFRVKIAFSEESENSIMLEGTVLDDSTLLSDGTWAYINTQAQITPADGTWSGLNCSLN